jgi:hypothetical protein
MARRINHVTKLQKLVRGYLTRNSKVLEPVNIKSLNLDISRLRDYVKSYLSDDRLNYYSETSTQNLELESGFSEWWVAKSTYGTRIGEGHCPVDVLTKDNLGIDVMCVCLNGNQTNEKSIMQNFSNSGQHLDTYFSDGRWREAMLLYVKDYSQKIRLFCQQYNSNKLYYLVFISTNKCVYLSSFRINIQALVNIRETGITPQKKSLTCINFIDPRYGTTKLYKSKKRLELRFNKNLLQCDNTLELYCSTST